MRDRLFYPLALLAALAMIALAMVWPQGMGALSPAPFGHPLAPPPPPSKPAATAQTQPKPTTKPQTGGIRGPE
jgi:hypothetical protein